VIFKKPSALIQAGIRPSWKNGDFKLLPNITAEFNVPEQRIGFQLGVVGSMRNSGFQFAASYNPWIWAPATVYSSRITERYAGIKGSAGDHFTYSARIAYNTIEDQPLFVNDTSSGKSFQVINEPRMHVTSLGGEIGYTVGEQFSVISRFTYNGYKLDVNDKPWGLLPLEWKTDVRLLVSKDLYVNGSLYAFDGPWSQSKSGRNNLGSVMELNAGLEYKVLSNLKVWGQFNNIFNKEYQRWNQYPVYGFNFLGGVVFSFGQKK
jgi:hypothetical protein